MAFRIRGSHVVAASLAAALGIWMMTGKIEVGGRAANAEAAQAIADREGDKAAELFKVRYVPLKPEMRTETLLVRGRTKADAVVTVRAETSGIVKQRLVAKGEKVSSGQTVCLLDKGTREAQLAQANAQLVQAEGDYESNLTLKEKGFAAGNRVNQLKAALDAARAAVAAAEQELSRAEVKANASGIVQDPVAEPGDMLTMGGTCVTLIDTDPMLFTGQVSEREIGKIAPGMKAAVTLVSGETVEGTIRYIAPSADPQTRTFAIEIAFVDGAAVRDGMTAEAVVALKPEQAFRLAPAWLTLADDGTIGIRTVDETDTVQFTPVRILAQTKEGIWVSGPEPGQRVISLGQEYVLPGEKVDPQPDERFAALMNGAAGNTASTGADQ